MMRKLFTSPPSPLSRPGEGESGIEMAHIERTCLKKFASPHIDLHLTKGRG